MAQDPHDLCAELAAYYGGNTEPRPKGRLVSKTGALPEPPRGGTLPPYQGLPDALYEDRAVLVLALRLEGYNYVEIQKKTGLSTEQVRYACRRARQAGKLRDVIDLIDNEAVPQAVENLNDLLQKGDKEATFEVLKGRGAFRRYSNDKQVGGIAATSIPALHINILTPAGGEMPTVIVNSDRGAVIGTPREDAD